ncbi:MAG: DMT family transporter [Gammaproteobacteria bacterium]|nr:DMT family transporter [Gammaproteobacteria bacterium]MDH3449272.1 DMT family transporter [Gammaproteobacteria bacterium]
MNAKAVLANWALLMVLVVLWGTSFMFTAISVATVDPVAVVFYRLGLGAVVLSLVIYARGDSFPLEWRVWGGFLIMAIAGNALPFFLISWGQLTVDSGVAGMIMAIMPLLTMVFAHYFVEGETLNRYKLMGFTLGITGVTLLLGPVFEGGGREFWGGLAIFTAATCYAINSILIKRLPRFSPMVGACGVLIMASLIMFPVWLIFAPENNNISQDSMFAVVWLGIGPTGIATIVLFAVIDRAGPTFLSTINYLIPVVAFLCGAWLLSEAVTWQHFVALAAILGGIGITRIRASQALR